MRGKLSLGQKWAECRVRSCLYNTIGALYWRLGEIMSLSGFDFSLGSRPMSGEGQGKLQPQPATSQLGQHYPGLPPKLRAIWNSSLNEPERKHAGPA